MIQNIFKNEFWKKISFAVIGISISSYSHLSLAKEQNQIEKLAEYNALDVFTEVIEGANTIFKSSPTLVKLETKQDGSTHLVSTKLTNNYSDLESHRFSLDKYIAKGVDYDLDIDNNDDTLYALLTNQDSATRDKKNLLFKSSDGAHWELYKTFPAEWELYDLDVDNKNISVTCVNCEDELKLSYMVSNDSGKSWKKYSLPETANVSYFSGMVDNKLFVIAANRNPENRKELINELMYTDLNNKNSNWITADTSKLQNFTKRDGEHELLFKLNDIENLLVADNYLIAEVTYATEATEDEESIETKQHLISRDNGKTWDKFNLKNLNAENIMQLDKKANTYHLVTSKNLEVLTSEDASNDSDDGLDLFGQFMEYIKLQKYRYYTLNTDDMDNTNDFEVSPKIEFDNSIGFNINYKHTPKASFVDTMLIHNDNDDLKLEFYRLHEE